MNGLIDTRVEGRIWIFWEWGVDLIYAEIEIQIDYRVRDNRRIGCGVIAFEISIRVVKDPAQCRLKAKPKTFYCDEMREFAEQNKEVM
jgi:hypothetical protein